MANILFVSDFNQGLSGGTGNWSTLADMLVDRDSAHGCVMSDGSLFVAGGFGDGEPRGLSSTESLSFSANSWTLRAFFPDGLRVQHQMAALPNRQALVLGGYYGNSSFGRSGSALKYDADTNTWSNLQTLTIGLANTRADNPIYLDDGRIMFITAQQRTVGSTGNDGGMRNPQIFDPTTNTFSSTTMTAARYYSAFTKLADGRVMVIGGRSAPQESQTLATHEIWNPTTNTWTQTTNIGFRLSRSRAITLEDGRVLIAGGIKYTTTGGPTSDCYLWSPANNTWTQTASLSDTRYEHFLAKLSDGRILMYGGRIDYGGGSNTPQSTQIFDPSTNTWSDAGQMAIGSYEGVALQRSNGDVVYLGGVSSGVDDDVDNDAISTVRMFS